MINTCLISTVSDGCVGDCIVHIVFIGSGSDGTPVGCIPFDHEFLILLL